MLCLIKNVPMQMSGLRQKMSDNLLVQGSTLLCSVVHTRLSLMLQRKGTLLFKIIFRSSVSYRKVFGSVWVFLASLSCFHIAILLYPQNHSYAKHKIIKGCNDNSFPWSSLVVSLSCYSKFNEEQWIFKTVSLKVCRKSRVSFCEAVYFTLQMTSDSSYLPYETLFS